ncbi:MAG: hypothetical protein D6741_07360, partial [Planctomycetota bacterium]
KSVTGQTFSLEVGRMPCSPCRETRCLIAAWGLVFALFAAPATSATATAAGPWCDFDAKTIRLGWDRWSVIFDATTGAVREIRQRDAEAPILTGEPDLWTIERRDGSIVRASEGRLRTTWDETRGMLQLDFTHRAADVHLSCRALPEGPLFSAVVAMKQGTALAWNFPSGLEFDVPAVEEFIFPDNIGVAFTRHFFEPGGAGVERRPLHGEGYRLVADRRCAIRPEDDPPKRLTPGKDAALLPGWFRNEIASRAYEVTADRPTTDPGLAFSLLETENGPWLEADRLGGRGLFVRYGGRMIAQDGSLTRLQAAGVIAVLEAAFRGAFDAKETSADDALRLSRGRENTRIAVLVGRASGRPGIRRSPLPGMLHAWLERLPWVRDARIEIVTLRTADELREALSADRPPAAIVNTQAECFPAESSTQAEAMLEAIRSYVRRGGLWFEAGGGYPFYYAIVPARDMKFASANRHFCDFAALDSKHGTWSLFGVQSPEAIYRAPTVEIAAFDRDGRRLGRVRHAFQVYIPEGNSAEVPTLQMTVAIPHRKALLRYGEANAYTRTLKEKVSPQLFTQLQRSILLKVTTGSLRRSAELSGELPGPVIFHVAEYLHGGFDRQYPDHLPPNPKVGTAEDLRLLIEAVRRNGHLFMPYTNPTWWCVNPKGPTFERYGDVVLARDLDGNVYPERYGEAYTQGYAICHWHPIVRKVNAEIRRQFTEEYPVDILFQDQIGARRSIWDTNPAAPDPAAYLEGLHRIAKTDSAFVPLGTEDGHDRLINYELMFCGLSWPWLPNRPDGRMLLYEDVWPRESWRLEPSAIFLAHDKALFFHHDLGGFTRDPRDVSISLVLGYGLSWWLHSANPSEQDRAWLTTLSRVQQAIGPELVGRRLERFDYLSPKVVRSVWGDLEVTANLSDSPWVLDAETTIAPDGFWAESPRIEVGYVVRDRGKNLASPGEWIVRVRENAP